MLSFFLHGEESEKEGRKEVKSYLLPSHHPSKAILDDIFTKSRALGSVKSMQKAGFSHPKPRKFTHLIVTRHKALPGYIIKAYLDPQRYPKDKPEYNMWIARIQGAQRIKQAIKKNGWQNLFKVPQKWIYQIPDTPKPSVDLPSKHFILIEEDMELAPPKVNKTLWRGEKVTPLLLDALYLLLEEVGLHDCAKPDNIPFCKDGRIAFIDTQSHDEWPVDYKKLNRYLSSPMQTYWKEKYKTSN